MGEREAGFVARTVRVLLRYQGPVCIQHRPGSKIAERSNVVLAADAKKHNVLSVASGFAFCRRSPGGPFADGMKARSSLAGTACICIAGPQHARRVVITRKEARRCG